MKTKLTLSIDKHLVTVARQQAHNQGASISGMFAEFVIAQKKEQEAKAKPGVAAMVGSLKGFAVDDSKEAIRKAYAKKHLR